MSVDWKCEAKKLNNKIHVIPSECSKQFIKNFNKNKPTEEFIESCKKARELFDGGNDKSTDQNVADVPIGETVSKAEVLALINKAMFNTDNKDTQDYIFNGLRRDVHNLPSEVCDDCIWRVCNYNSVDWEKPTADRPKGEWIAVEDDCENIYWECSNCEDAFYLEVGTPKSNNYNYCPCCGADMRGEK